LPEGVIVLPMPSLSHAMERGTVKRWLKQEGELCSEYDLVRDEAAAVLNNHCRRWYCRVVGSMFWLCLDALEAASLLPDALGPSCCNSMCITALLHTRVIALL
jgi:hypothetical protein